MPNSDSDPRVFFSAERTLLAWLRSGLTIIGIGFVVARFGLYLRVLSPKLPPHPYETSFPLSAVLGIAFVVVGSLAIFAAAIQYYRFVAALSPPALPSAYSKRIALIVSVVVAMLGVALAAYLLMTSM